MQTHISAVVYTLTTEKLFWESRDAERHQMRFSLSFSLHDGLIIIFLSCRARWCAICSAHFSNDNYFKWEFDFGGNILKIRDHQIFVLGLLWYIIFQFLRLWHDMNKWLNGLSMPLLFANAHIPDGRRWHQFIAKLLAMSKNSLFKYRKDRCRMKMQLHN